MTRQFDIEVRLPFLARLRSFTGLESPFGGSNWVDRGDDLSRDLDRQRENNISRLDLEGKRLVLLTQLQQLIFVDVLRVSVSNLLSLGVAEQRDA